MLGGLSVSSAGRELVFPTSKSRLLLAYLACTPGRLHARGRLCALFWEDRGEEQARGSLRNALSHIRSVAGEGIIAGNRESVGVRAGGVETDVAELEQLADGNDPLGGHVLALAGEFLSGVEADGSALRDWLDFERSRCRTLAQKLLERASGAASSQGDHDAAIMLARRLVEIDSFREASHRLLMRVLAASGDRAMALSQFQTCRDLLRAELDVAPSPQTEALVAELSGQPARQHAVARADFQLSIAVLPFAHADANEDQRFLAEGLSDDITTELTRHRDILVIARQSSFQFAGGAPDDAARSLGARYVLTGALRRRSDLVSLSVQLLDASSQRTCWAERFERSTDDLFAMQDDIVSRILASVDAEMRLSERERAARRPPSDLDAWELFHRGLWHAFRFRPDEADRATAAFSRAVELAPEFALPRAGLAYADLLRITWRMGADPKAVMARAIANARDAVDLDATNPFAQVVLGRLLTYAGQPHRAFDHLWLARDLNPSYAATYYALATAHLWNNEPGEALYNAQQALRFSPRDPLAAMFHTVQSFAKLLLGEPGAAEELALRAIDLQPREVWAQAALACARMELGEVEAARQVIAEAGALLPDVTLSGIRPVSSGVAPVVRDRILGLLKQAGLREA